MVTESFLVTALPHSAASDADFHVSLFFSHRLTPDGAARRVKHFPNIRNWTERLADAEIRLRGGKANGTVVDIGATPLLAALDPALWAQVFPPELPVRPWQVPNHTAVPWRTYPAHRMQQHALLVHGASVFSSPVASPSVKGNILTDPLLRTLGLDQRELSLDAVLAGTVDTMISRRIDDMVTRGQGHGTGSTADSPMARLVTDVELARRYYQRPEEQRPYQERPVPGTPVEPVKKPDPDFHERAGLLGDLSPLLRRLGLVLDLQVDQLPLLSGLVWIQAQVEIPGLPNPIGSQPRVACQVLGRTFTATSESGDFTAAMLRLGDEDRFTVLDLDPDASALKLEQYVRNLPRLAVAENNGDAENSAPSTLRATGFAVARPDRASMLHDRLDGAAAKDSQLLSGTASPLHLEQVSRGIRLETWDDASGEWHSLHERLLTVDVEGAGRVLDSVPDVGFLQGAALTQADGQPGAPKHAHEVLAGWDGWSLSAPRPGNVVVHDNGDEHVLDQPPADPEPVNPVASSGTVAPGTLPRLRYGRRYAFRAYAVDLAGNSPPHRVGGGPTTIAAARTVRAGRPDGTDGADGADGTDGPAQGDVPFDAQAAATHAESLLASKPSDATASPKLEGSQYPGEAVRDRLRVLRPARAEGPVAGKDVPGTDPGATRMTGVEEVDRIVAARVGAAAGQVFSGGSGRRQQIETAFARAADQSVDLLRRTDIQTSPEVYGSALTALAAGQTGLLPSVGLRGGLSLGAFLTLLGEVVSTPRPFLRWDPVIEPATVPRHPYTEGESLLRLVIRSGVEQAAPGELALTIVEPAAYAVQATGDHPGLGLQWREDSQRHLAPPKTSQFEAELHGAFDAAIGGGTPAEVRAALAIALRESGTFFQDTVADLADPGQRLPQPGIAFVVSPTAEEPEHATPADLPRGTAPTPGQYVVHDVDALELPYLPDPLAVGISLRFPDAGRDHRLSGVLALEGTTLRYVGDWPDPRPFRFVLEAGAELGAVVEGHVVRVTVPPGEHLRIRMSSCLDRASLPLLGLWHSMPPIVQADPVLSEAAADGWFWWLTPSTEVRLVHAVPRPVEVPRPTVLLARRSPGDTDVRLLGAVDVHGPSTDRIDVEAAWSEWVDDVSKPAPERVDAVAAAFGTSVAYEEDLVVLAGEAGTFALPDGSVLALHASKHQMGDTHHRDVDYRVRATTRYKEYFSPQVTPGVGDLSVVGPTRRIDVANSARPARVVVRDVLPLFRWDERTEPAQPFGLRRTRRAGLRIYLDRPWYTTGDGELLGVVVSPSGDALVQGSVSQWGGDPVWFQQGPASRAALPLVDLLHLVGLDDRAVPGRPVGKPATLPLVDVAGHPSAWVLGYQPEFSSERNMWFVDVAFDPATAFWPFVRLAVVRYQPSSLPGLHLGPVSICDFAQLAPERAATLTRPDDRHARVVVTGPIGLPQTPRGEAAPRSFADIVAASRVMRARLERHDASVGTDLGWVTVAQQVLPILSAAGPIVSWSGQLELPQQVPPRTPGNDSVWRVTVEEWERLPADPLTAGAAGGFEQRIVYADHFPL